MLDDGLTSDRSYVPAAEIGLFRGLFVAGDFPIHAKRRSILVLK